MLDRLKVLTAVAVALAAIAAADNAGYDPVAEAAAALARMNVKPGDCPQFGVSRLRNNVSAAPNIPSRWDVDTGLNVKWSAALGSQTYGTPVVANGKVFVGTNNGNGYLKRFPKDATLGVLLCFDEANGKFLWQHSAPIPQAKRDGIRQCSDTCSSPYVEGNRLWYVTIRDEVVCLDTEGFLDGENDGPATDEPNQDADDADVIWKVDLVAEVGLVAGRKVGCSVTAYGDILFVCTSNGFIAGKGPANARSPSFLAMDKNSGKVLWTDHSPGENILNGQWSSPAVGVLGGVEQVIFGGGDGWLYGFDIRGENGHSKLLWKFDCNPKTGAFRLERSTRNPVFATPVIYDGLVYVGVGQDPRYGDGPGHLWCIDPTKRGDVSPTLVFNKRDPSTPIPPRRLQAIDPQAGEFERDNENSASVWHYVGANHQHFEETMHRTLCSVAIKDDLLFVADESGLCHCLDAKTGAVYWTHDLLVFTMATPLVVGNRVYIADQDGKISVLAVAKKKELISEQSVGAAVFGTPIVANGVLYIATNNRLFAIANPP